MKPLRIPNVVGRIILKLFPETYSWRMWEGGSTFQKTSIMRVKKRL